MNRVYFNLRDFPKFIDEMPIGVNNSISMTMRTNGYPSVEFEDKKGGLTYSMVEEEYTWFVLRWS